MPVNTSMIDAYGFYSKYVNTVGRFSNSRGDGKEYHGPCPFCGGTDRFAFWDSGRYSCDIRLSGCGRRGGDPIDFLREYEGLDFFAVCNELGVDPGSEYTRFEKAPDTFGLLTPPCKQWQERAGELVQLTHRKLGGPIGKMALDYLHGRGFTDETIRQAQLGYIPLESTTGRWYCDTFDAWGLKAEDYPGKKGVWLYEGILIPCYVDGQLWSLTVRRLTDLARDDPRHLAIRGGVDALYNADAICSDTPVVLCEAPLDALSGIQECQGLNAVFVATSSASKTHDPLWIARINRAPYTLIAFDDDEEKNGKRAGDEGASYWRSVLSRRYQILPWAHDINDMLKAGMDLREWVASGVAEYEAIQTSKQFVAAPVVAAPEPVYVPVEDEPERPVLDVAALRAEIGQLVRAEDARWEYSNELDPRWPASAKVYKRLCLKEGQVQS